MGSGKSSLGKKLAKSLDKKFIDTDKEIEKSKKQFRESTKIMLHENSSINEKLNNIVKLDPNFTVENFVDGAKKAFELASAKLPVKTTFVSLDQF